MRVSPFVPTAVDSAKHFGGYRVSGQCGRVQLYAPREVGYVPGDCLFVVFCRLVGCCLCVCWLVC